MKSWNKYCSILPSLSYDQIMFQYTRIIDDTPLTKSQREEKYATAQKQALKDHEILMKEYQEDTARLVDVFWEDCWIELHGNFCTKAQKIIENYAWEKGHEDGLPKVFEYLEEIVNLFSDVENENNAYECGP